SHGFVTTLSSPRKYKTARKWSGTGGKATPFRPSDAGRRGPRGDLLHPGRPEQLATPCGSRRAFPDPRYAVRPYSVNEAGVMDTIRLPGPRVLVVDNCHEAAVSLAWLLERWGFQPVLAYDGPSALAVALARPPDAVLLEVGLPGMD